MSALYDGMMMEMYVDGIQTATNRNQYERFAMDDASVKTGLRARWIGEVARGFVFTHQYLYITAALHTNNA